MVCAAEDAMTALPGGDEGVPEDDVRDCDLSFADDDGIGSH